MDISRRYSKKRSAILDAIKGTDVHPSAEWIYRQLKPDFPDLSLATVYRNLQLFEEQGDIVRVGVVNGQERYDGRLSEHTHFICTRCGAVVDVFGGRGHEDYAEIEAETGGRVDARSVVYRGLCRNCVNEGDASPELYN